MAKNANNQLKASSITRVDLGKRKKGEEGIYVLEQNTQP